MYRALRISLGVTAATLLGLAVWGCCGLTRHLIVAVDRIGDAGAGLAQTTAKLNGPHGTIAMADEDAGALKSAIVHADLVARHEQQSLSTWDARGSQLFNNLNGGVTDLRATITAATKATDAATDLTQALTVDARTANGTIAAAQPLLVAATGTVTRVNTEIDDPHVRHFMLNLESMSGSGAGIMANGKTASDYLTKQLVTPKTFLQKAKGYAGDTFDVLSFLARHYR